MAWAIREGTVRGHGQYLLGFENGSPLWVPYQLVVSITDRARVDRLAADAKGRVVHLVSRREKRIRERFEDRGFIRGLTMGMNFAAECGGDYERDGFGEWAVAANYIADQLREQVQERVQDRMSPKKRVKTPRTIWERLKDA